MTRSLSETGYNLLNRCNPTNSLLRAFSPLTFCRLKTKDEYYNTIDSLGLFIKKLNDEVNNGALVVVEGQRDAEALESIGFNGEPFLLCHNRGLARLARQAEDKRKVILLLDLDSKGRSLTKKTAILLQEKKHVIDLFFRRELLSATRGRIRQIEELRRFKGYVQQFGNEYSRLE